MDVGAMTKCNRRILCVVSVKIEIDLGISRISIDYIELAESYFDILLKRLNLRI